MNDGLTHLEKREHTADIGEESGIRSDGHSFSSSLKSTNHRVVGYDGKTGEFREVISC